VLRKVRRAVSWEPDALHVLTFFVMVKICGDLPLPALVMCRRGYRDSHYREQEGNVGCEMHGAAMVLVKDGG